MKKEISLEAKQKIYHSYYSGKSYEELSKDYSRSINFIRDTIREMNKIAKKEDSLETRYYKNIPIDTIISELNEGASLTKMAEQYNVDRNTIKKLLGMSEEGKRALNSAQERYQNRKKDIPREKLEEALQEKGGLVSLQEDYNISYTTLRNRIAEYGLEKPKTNLAETKPPKKKRVLSKNQFFESLRSYPLDDLLKEAKKRNIEVPEEYIKEYNQTINKTTNITKNETIPSNKDTRGGEER